jgi:hypothetical protein
MFDDFCANSILTLSQQEKFLKSQTQEISFMISGGRLCYITVNEYIISNQSNSILDDERDAG